MQNPHSKFGFLFLILALTVIAGLDGLAQKTPPEQVVFQSKMGNVTFNHAAHLKRANNDCKACHDKLFRNPPRPSTTNRLCIRQPKPPKLRAPAATIRGARHLKPKATAPSATSRPEASLTASTGCPDACLTAPAQNDAADDLKIPPSLAPGLHRQHNQTASDMARGLLSLMQDHQTLAGIAHESLNAEPRNRGSRSRQCRRRAFCGADSFHPACFTRWRRRRDHP